MWLGHNVRDGVTPCRRLCCRLIVCNGYWYCRRRRGRGFAPCRTLHLAEDSDSEYAILPSLSLITTELLTLTTMVNEDLGLGGTALTAGHFYSFGEGFCGQLPFCLPTIITDVLCNNGEWSLYCHC